MSQQRGGGGPSPRGARGARGGPGGSVRGHGGGRGSFHSPPRGGGGGGGGRGGGGSVRGRGGAAAPEIYRPTPMPVPDASVEALENKLLPANKPAQDLARLNIDRTTPLRPGFGTKGIPVVLLANYFRIRPELDKIIYRYSLQVSPDIASGRLKRQLIKLIFSADPLKSLAPGLASDFAATLVTAQPLKPNQLQFDITFCDEGEAEPDPKAKKHTVTLSAAGSFRLGDLVDHITSTNLSAAFADKADTIQLLNIIANTTPKLRNTRETLSTKTNRHFNVTGPNATSYDLTAALEAWRGYFSSARTGTSRLLVNVQIKHLAMFKSQRLDLSIAEFLTSEGASLDKLERLLRRVRVDRLHLLKKNKKNGRSFVRPKAIYGLARPSDGRKQDHPPKVPRLGATAKEVQIWMDANPPPGVKPNGYITVAKFFNAVHGMTLSDKAPVMNLGTRENPAFLPAEVLHVIPAQPSLSKLSPHQTSKMINFAVRPPYMNAKSIAEIGLTEVGLTQQNPILRAFGLEVDPQMIAVKARILPPPSLKYRANRAVQPRFGAWNLAENVFTQGATLSRWSVLWIQSEHPRARDAWNKDSELLVETLKAFQATLVKCGVQASPPALPGVTATVAEAPDIDDNANDEANIRDGFKRLLNKYSNPRLEYVLVLLPSSSASTYNAVKRASDVEFGVNCTCVGPKFARDNNVQYFANVALKINLKLGGINHTLDHKGLGFIAEGKTMVVGVDVTHPSPGSAENAPSVAAMVASTDGFLGRFLAALHVQPGRREMVVDLAGMLKSRLEIWKRYNRQTLPENIVVYRDGVSTGQHDLVLQEELPKLREACAGMYGKGKQPSFAILIAGKRIHTRFYPTSTHPDQIDARSSNIKNGTVVDRSITDAADWDFFLTAHTALQGTAIPCHYSVLLDEVFSRQRLPAGMGNHSDLITEITHHMSYLFGRATRAVSYAPPAYYADLACERARCYLSGVYSPAVSQAGSSSGSVSGGQATSSPSTFTLHANIKDTMFFI